MKVQGIIERYRSYLPVGAAAKIISLGEGNTPLVQASRLSESIHPRIDLFLKLEGLNPTGSFKDRGMTMAITNAVDAGYTCIMCASTGNTSASAAAYAARAGIHCAVLIPEGKIALGKLSQAMIHGAKVIQLKGNFDEALAIVRSITEHHPIALVNSINPYRIEGQKTGAFEIVDHFGGAAPDYHVLPVGNAGNITAYWKGYKEYFERGVSENLPRMLGFQAAGAAPIVLGKPVEKPDTFATAIRIGNPASWKGAIAAREESEGLIGMVTDREIKSAYLELAKLEGVFCEPASAAGVAGLYKLAASGYFDHADAPRSGSKYRVVAVLTGHGLKDPDNAIRLAASEPLTIEANEDAVLGALDMKLAVPVNL
ncbi:MAG: threonine synthase [Candidatus Hydrogenedentota bacterium]